MITLDELRALDDAAFNRAVAEAAGWRVEYGMLAGYGWHREAWQLYDAEGDMRNGETGSDTEAEAWSYAPDYANDLYAALPLLGNAWRERLGEGE